VCACRYGGIGSRRRHIADAATASIQILKHSCKEERERAAARTNAEGSARPTLSMNPHSFLITIKILNTSLPLHQAARTSASDCRVDDNASGGYLEGAVTGRIGLVRRKARTPSRRN
jgi:hypothetical protein